MMKTKEIYFVTGIGTDVGKTVFSAILTHALNADYWKPVQCGDLASSDSLLISKLLPGINIIPSVYSFPHPISPHAAAKLEQETISLALLKSQHLKTTTVIEGAGGIMVPINETENTIDIAKVFDAEVILVIKYYLGCINHSLLTINELVNRQIKIKGLVFNGVENPESRRIILTRSQLPCLLDIQHENEIASVTIEQYSEKLKENLNELQ
jgi:dethiobiotin synthetase